MKALVLAGGTGSRLRPITFTAAKQLVPVANKPILFYGLEWIREAGIEDVGIVVGDTAAEIEAAVGDGSALGIRATYIRQSRPGGLAHAVKESRGFLGDDEFVMYLGDNLLRAGIKDIVEAFRRERPNAQVLLAKVPNPQEFGVAVVEGGRVVRLVEKPKEPPSDLALCGVYLFDRQVFESIDRLTPSPRGELEITDAIQGLIDRGLDVRMRLVEGWWKDTGKLEDLLEANRLVLDDLEADVRGRIDESSIAGRVAVAEGAEIVRSNVRGPAVIGAGARVVDSYVGPYSSVGAGVRIEGSEIEHSIVLEGAVIRGLRRIADSLVGKNARILRTEARPKAYRFMLGDSSTVEVAE